MVFKLLCEASRKCQIKLPNFYQPTFLSILSIPTKALAYQCCLTRDKSTNRCMANAIAVLGLTVSLYLPGKSAMSEAGLCGAGVGTV